VPARRQEKRCRKHIEFRNAHAKEKGRGEGGKGEFCGKVRDSKQGLPRSKTRVT
jgi:hypothetical protein